MKKRNWKRVIAALGVAAMIGTEFGSDFTAIRTYAEEPIVEDQTREATADEPAAEEIGEEQQDGAIEVQEDETSENQPGGWSRTI